MQVVSKRPFLLSHDYRNLFCVLPGPHDPTLGAAVAEAYGPLEPTARSHALGGKERAGGLGLHLDMVEPCVVHENILHHFDLDAEGQLLEPIGQCVTVDEIDRRRSIPRGFANGVLRKGTGRN